MRFMFWNVHEPCALGLSLAVAAVTELYTVACSLWSWRVRSFVLLPA